MRKNYYAPGYNYIIQKKRVSDTDHALLKLDHNVQKRLNNKTLVLYVPLKTITKKTVVKSGKLKEK